MVNRGAISQLWLTMVFTMVDHGFTMVQKLMVYHGRPWKDHDAFQLGTTLALNTSKLLCTGNLTVSAHVFAYGNSLVGQSGGNMS